MVRRFCRDLLPGFIVALWVIRLYGAANDPSILNAVLQRDAAAVQQLLKTGADANVARGDGLTALHAAAIQGDVAIAQMLIVAGANVGASTVLIGSTPLHLAAKHGQAAVVELLVKNGADPNRRDTLGTTALMLAAASGNVDAVAALLDAGADPNAKESARGETALMFAAASGRTDCVATLLRRGADWRLTTNVFDWTKLPKTDPRLASGDAHPVKSGKSAGSEPTAPAPDEKPTEPVRAKGESGKPGDATGARVEPRPPSYLELVGTQGGLTALMFAARQGHLETVQAFVDHGADVNEVDPGDSSTALMVAIINGRFDVAMYLIEHGANPNLAQTNGSVPLYAILNTRWAPKSEYPNPLHYATQRVDYLRLMKALLDHGAEPNARLKRKLWYTNQNNDQSGVDETGATPFWRAAYADDVEAMKLLVAYGADPNIPTAYPGKAEEYPPPDETKTEDVSGLPPPVVGGPNITPLLAASGEGYGWSFTANHHRFAPTGMLPAVKYLVEVLHADVNAPDAAGNTALHNAASRGDNDMILYLVSKGANAKAVNRKGQTVADMANGPMQRIQPFPQTVALLAKLGVQLRQPCVSC